VCVCFRKIKKLRKRIQLLTVILIKLLDKDLTQNKKKRERENENNVSHVNITILIGKFSSRLYVIVSLCNVFKKHSQSKSLQML
jgi:hypothetical protein